MSGKKPSVLLIYAKDNEYHCNAVQRFALYLQQRCHCEVKFDLWCPDEISEISALDWLLRHIKSAENVVVVNSEGGWRQYDGSARNVAFERIRSETPLEDMFLLAMKELENKRIFKVAFPYTHSRYFIGDAVHSGRTYVLMNDVEDLFLGVQQLSKHSVRGKKLASDINASDYTKCKEGQSLAAAIKEASEFLQAKPDWFSEFYFEKNLSLEDCHPSPVFDSGFEPGAEYGNSAGDQYEMPFDDETHGFTFYPPSDLDDNASSVSVSNIEELFAFVNSEYENTMTN